MSRYFAQINNGIVQRVIASHTKEWCEQNLGGVWVETFMGKADKKYAGIGYSYDSVKDRFIAPKPYDSWTLDDTTGEWQPPVKIPKDLTNKGWSEKDMSWKDIEIIKQEKWQQ